MVVFRMNIVDWLMRQIYKNVIWNARKVWGLLGVSRKTLEDATSNLACIINDG